MRTFQLLRSLNASMLLSEDKKPCGLYSPDHSKCREISHDYNITQSLIFRCIQLLKPLDVTFIKNKYLLDLKKTALTCNFNSFVFSFPKSFLYYIRSLLVMGVAILTSVQCRQKCLFGYTWLIQSRLIELGARGLAVLVSFLFYALLKFPSNKRPLIECNQLWSTKTTQSLQVLCPNFISRNQWCVSCWQFKGWTIRYSAAKGLLPWIFVFGS